MRPGRADNILLSRLEPRELRALHAHMQEVLLKRGEVLVEAGELASHVYFPLEGALSLVGVTENGATVEVAAVGNEGVASISSLLGAQWLPFRVITNVAGRALRVPTPVGVRHLRECGAFHQAVLELADRLILQLSQSAVCNRFHNARQRLARWLLSTADRAVSSALPLTHEFVAMMIGGPRSAVTEASAALRDSGAIQYARGILYVRDRERLLLESCECYAALVEAAASAAAAPAVPRSGSW